MQLYIRIHVRGWEVIMKMRSEMYLVPSSHRSSRTLQNSECDSARRADPNEPTRARGNSRHDDAPHAPPRAAIFETARHTLSPQRLRRRRYPQWHRPRTAPMLQISQVLPAALSMRHSPIPLRSRRDDRFDVETSNHQRQTRYLGHNLRHAHNLLAK